MEITKFLVVLLLIYEPFYLFSLTENFFRDLSKD